MIIIGDVHGCYKSLRALVKKCPPEPICFVGDLIDRGPDSKGVVEFVRGEGHQCVLGNHEELMIKFSGQILLAAKNYE
ncbi:MAG: metallophosphoesterase [bacterium]|nr:metallophosphoesterase [bacterium]